MAKKVFIGAEVTGDEKNTFHKRCIDHNTTMTKVIKEAMREFMRTHMPMGEKYGTIQ